jgi:hypothetical protein
MNVEPAHTDAAPRPKGFVRRNWLPLTCLVSLIPLAFLQGGFRIVNTASTTTIILKDGIVYAATSRVYLSPEPFAICAPCLAWDWLPFLVIETPTRWRCGTPLWLPLLIFVIWIAFREWWRKRAAKGKACPQ